ncbi:hypothetical protein [Streptomyces reniochalinae]|uniref:hypothetical protein n=1 Tax=Streptomyces reniochalinae TaxID=2250578 RepID=UPI0011C040D5|nr:hypothetical protein [Streptomyces reniochalinae]
MESPGDEYMPWDHSETDAVNLLDHSTVHGPAVQARDIEQLTIAANSLHSDRYQAYAAFCTVWEDLQVQILQVATSLWIVSSLDQYKTMVYRSETLYSDLERRHRRISLLDGEDAPSRPVLEAAKRAVRAVGPYMYAWSRGNDEAISDAEASNYESLMNLNEAEAAFERFVSSASKRLRGGGEIV